MLGEMGGVAVQAFLLRAHRTVVHDRLLGKLDDVIVTVFAQARVLAEDQSGIAAAMWIMAVRTPVFHWLMHGARRLDSLDDLLVTAPAERRPFFGAQEPPFRGSVGIVADRAFPFGHGVVHDFLLFKVLVMTAEAEGALIALADTLEQPLCIAAMGVVT